MRQKIQKSKSVGPSSRGEDATVLTFALALLAIVVAIGALYTISHSLSGVTVLGNIPPSASSGPQAITNFTEVNLPQGAIFTVIFDNISNSVTVGATRPVISFTTSTGSQPYAIPNVTYGGMQYYIQTRTGVITAGSSALVTYYSSPLQMSTTILTSSTTVPTTTTIPAANTIPVQLNVSTQLSVTCGTSHGCVSSKSYKLIANWKAETPPYSLLWYSGAGTLSSCPLGTLLYSQNGITSNSSSEAIAPAGTSSYCLKVSDSAGNLGYSQAVAVQITTTTTIPYTTSILQGPHNAILTTNTPIVNGSSPLIKLYAAWVDGSNSPAPYQLIWEASPSPQCAGYSTTQLNGVSTPSFYQTYNLLTLPFNGTIAYFCYTVFDSAARGSTSPILSVNLQQPTTTIIQPVSVQLTDLVVASVTCGTSHGCVPGPSSYTLKANWTGGTPPYSLFWYSGTTASCPSGTLFYSQNGITATSMGQPISPPAGTTSYCLKVAGSTGSAGYSATVPVAVTATTTSTSTTTTSTTTTTAPPTKVAETGLPVGATFNVIYNSKPTLMTVTASNTVISLSTAVSGNYAYSIPVSTYGGVGYIPTPKSGYVTTGSSISTTFAANQLLSLPPGGFLPQAQVLSGLNSYLSPNITASGDAIGNFSILGIYDTGNIEAVLLDCNTDPISLYPCLIEFDFNSAGQLVNITSSN